MTTLEPTDYAWPSAAQSNVTALLGMSKNDTNVTIRDRFDFQQFQYYAWGVVGNIISIFGLIGNVLSMAVLCHRKMRNSTSVFLMALAIYDSVVLISLVLCMALPTLRFKIMLPYIQIFPYLQPFAYPLALTAQTCSIYTTVGFTVERYIAVCHPLKAANFCTISRAQKSVLLIFLSSVIYNIPRMLEYRTVLDTNPATNVTEATFQLTELGGNSMYRHIYFIYMHISFMLLIPFGVLVFMNIALIRAVRRSSHAAGKQISKKQKNENNLTVMLISVVAVFLICEVPSIMDNIFMATMDKQDLMKSAPLIKLTCLSSLMVITNSAINFYLYCVFGEKFRQVFCRIFCRRCLGNRMSLFQEESMVRLSMKSVRHQSHSSQVSTKSKRSAMKSDTCDSLVLNTLVDDEQSMTDPNCNDTMAMKNNKNNGCMSKHTSNGRGGWTAHYTPIKDDTTDNGVDI